MSASIELTRLSAPQREALLRDLARSGRHPVTVGDRIEGPAGRWVVSEAPYSAGVLLDGRPVATVGARATVPADAHGCPACPHPASGMIVSGLPGVLINGRPVAVAGSETTHRSCCTPGGGWLAEGAGAQPGTKQGIDLARAMVLRRSLVRAG